MSNHFRRDDMISELTIVPQGKGPGKKDASTEIHTLEEALEELRILKNRGEVRFPATIWCKGGVYPVPEPILITPEHSMPVTIKALPGEEVVFDGGYHLKDWKKTKLNGKNVLRASVPDCVIHDGAVHQFHVNGKRKTRAAWPKLPEVLTPEKPGVEFKNTLFNTSDCFYVKKGDFNPNWYNPQGIEAQLYQLWTESHLPVESFDPKTGLVKFRYCIRCEVNVASTRYTWQNVREALTEPGEFYFDNIEKCIYYLPEKGENEKNIDAVIPRTGVILMLAGNAKEKEFVQGIRFDGLTFRYAGAGIPKGGLYYDTPASPGIPPCRNYYAGSDTGEKVFGGCGQASANVPGVILVTGAKDCAFENCKVEHSNWYGFCIAAGSSAIELSYNELADLGGGGIIVSGSAAVQHEPEQAVHHISVTDNHIHDCGAYFLSAVGILLGHARNCLVEHNHVHDLYYTAISCGWVWGYGETESRENRIGFNLLHDIGKEMLCDMGGIYTLGIQPGTRIYNNLIFNVRCRFYGGWGIYTDEGSSHIVIENNICYDCSRECFHQHYGRENIVRHNIAAYGEQNGIAITSGHNRQTRYESLGENYTVNYNFYTNVILVDGTPFYRTCFHEAIAPDQFFTDLNILWDVSTRKKRIPFATGDQNWKLTKTDWLKMGHDTHSVFADPGFVNPEKRDFHLKKDSILLKSGFPDPAITIENAGVRKKKKNSRKA